MANYLTYPFRTMCITQNYNGRTSHYPHTTGNIKDFPIDEAGADYGRDPFYCPCDEMKIVKIYGVGNRGTNTMWVESTTKVKFADGTEDYVCGQLTHMNDSDFNSLYVGKRFKRGQIICHEGTDGATGNHIHHSWGKGTIIEGGWSQNSNGKWVLRASHGTFKPEQLFFVDRKFTAISYAGGLAFKTLPEQNLKYKPGMYKVTAKITYVRDGAGKKNRIKGFKEFTANAQAQIKQLNKGKEAEGYIKGVEFSAVDVVYNEKDKLYWGKTPSGWVCLDRCEVR